MFRLMNGKIQEKIDPWIFDGMTDVFASCSDHHPGIIHLPDSNSWDFDDIEIPRCSICGNLMSVGGCPKWRLTNLPINKGMFLYSDIIYSGIFGFLELIWSFFLVIFRWWND